MPSPLRAPLLLLALVSLLLAGCSSGGEATKPTATDSPAAREARAADALGELEETYDARLGVYAVDTGSGAEVAHRADERFAFASTAKALLAAVLLDTTEPADLDRTIRWTTADVVTYSPFTEPRAGSGAASGATLGEVAEAMVRESDNTAFNLVVRELGGIDALRDGLRAAGDKTTRPARLEPDLNAAVPGDERDTSTPRALASTLRGYLPDGDLSPADAEVLDDWMTGNATGDSLVRAGVPQGWRVADKSGAAAYGTRNDVAVVHPPGREPIVIVVLSSRDEQDAAYDDGLVADAARVAVRELTR